MSKTIADETEMPGWAQSYRTGDYPPYGYTADVVGFCVDADMANIAVAIITRGQEPFKGHFAFPGGFVEWERDLDARAAALRELKEETGLGLPGYMETLDTYDKNGRDPRQYAGLSNSGRGFRVVSKAQLALFSSMAEKLTPEEGEDASAAQWMSVYDILPWEDTRSPAGQLMLERVLASLDAWVQSKPKSEREDLLLRIDYAFGIQLTDWNEERTAERYELLFEAQLLEEAFRDKWGQANVPAKQRAKLVGQPLAFDHRQMIADALGRVRGKMKYRPIMLSALMPKAEFTLRDLQILCQAIAGRVMYRQNFPRVIAESAAFRIVEDTGAVEATGRRGPPARIYRFPADVGQIRLDPSIRMPWLPVKNDE